MTKPVNELIASALTISITLAPSPSTCRTPWLLDGGLMPAMSLMYVSKAPLHQPRDICTLGAGSGVAEWK